VVTDANAMSSNKHVSLTAAARDVTAQQQPADMFEPVAQLLPQLLLLPAMNY